MITLYTRHIYFMDLAKYGCDVKYINMVSDRMSRDTCVTCPMLPRVTCASLTNPAIPSCLAPGAAAGVLALLAPDWSRLSSPGR